MTVTLPLTDIAIADNLKLEHVDFLSLLHVLFRQCVLYYVLMSFSVLALSCTSISPDPIVVPKQNLYHIKPDGEGSCLWKMEKNLKIPFLKTTNLIKWILSFDLN